MGDFSRPKVCLIRDRMGILVCAPPLPHQGLGPVTGLPYTGWRATVPFRLRAVLASLAAAGACAFARNLVRTVSIAGPDRPNGIHLLQNLVGGVPAGLDLLGRRRAKVAYPFWVSRIRRRHRQRCAQGPDTSATCLPMSACFSWDGNCCLGDKCCASKLAPHQRKRSFNSSVGNRHDAARPNHR